MSIPGISDNRVAPFIEGVLSRSTGDAIFDVTNPSNGQRCLSIPQGSKEDVVLAVASSRGAFDDGRWKDAAPSFRKQVLHRFADLMAIDATQLDALDAEEMGKPVSVAFCNALEAANLLRFYAEAVDKITGSVFTSDKDSFVAQTRVPRGVVAAIVPWNFPTFNAILKVAPALAAGNCVVLKPSELASRSALRIGALALEAGLPPGVLNVVPGLGLTVGQALALHMNVDMVTFTGSTEVGKWMMQYSGQSNMKVVMTECGGKSPQIVFGDGLDLDAAASSIAQSLMTNQGQICSVGSRLLVQENILDVMVEKIAAHFGQIVMGNASDSKTTYGPLVTEKQCAKVMNYIETAQAEGATLVSGGRRVLRDTGGYFVEPTLFAGVKPAARIAREEIFGPVLSVMPFRDQAEAIRIANETIYGLAAYVWTADLSTAMRMAKGVQASVFVNAVASSGEGAGYAFSHEPTGQSGVGTESGLAGMESYMRRHLIWVTHA